MDEQSYVLVESTYYLQKHHQVRYGIALVEHDDPIDIIIQTICDVSTDRRLVEKIVALCNKVRPPKELLVNLIVKYIG